MPAGPSAPTGRPPRIALVYCRAPSGHAQAAAAIEEELRARVPGAEALTLELARDLHPRLGPLVARAWLAAARTAPGLWEALYGSAAAAAAAGALLAPLRRREGERLCARLAAWRPDAVVATQALPCAVLAAERLSGRLAAPLLGVLTDFAPNRYWPARGADRICVASEAARAELERRGVPAGRLRLTGIPVRRALRAPAAPAEARRRLGLDPARPVVLVSGGTRGLGAVAPAVAGLLALMPRPQILACCGVNEPLFQRLRALGAQDLHLRRGLDPGMAEAVAAADLFVGKPGGVSAAEALAAGLPLLLTAALPGQETRNADWLVRRGAARRADGAGEPARATRQLLADAGARGALAARARALGRPDAAARVCDAVLDLLARGPRTEAAAPSPMVAAA